MSTKQQMGALALLGWMLLIVGMAGCGSSEEKEPEVPPLRVGVTPDYPPIIFKNGTRFDGVEADLARALGAELGRPVEFVEIERRPLLLTELQTRGVDILMSGVSITRARKLQVAFADPYLANALMGMTKVEKAAEFDTKEKILATKARVGVQRGTTADSFVQRNCPNAKRVALGRPDGAIMEFQRDWIDVFIHDAHSIAWLVSNNEANYVPLLEPLQTEWMAWAVRRADQQLLGEVNAVLRAWKENGVLEGVLRRWLAYYDRTLEWDPPAE